MQASSAFMESGRPQGSPLRGPRGESLRRGGPCARPGCMPRIRHPGAGPLLSGENLAPFPRGRTGVGDLPGRRVETLDFQSRQDSLSPLPACGERVPKAGEGQRAKRACLYLLGRHKTKQDQTASSLRSPPPHPPFGHLCRPVGLHADRRSQARGCAARNACSPPHAGKRNLQSPPGCPVAKVSPDSSGRRPESSALANERRPSPG
jgi:hypothetical protein